MIDLIVIHPMAQHGIKGDHAIYGELGASLVAVEPPTWARILAAYVRERGYSVKIIDAEAEKLQPADVAARINTERPRLVCIAAYGHMPSASTQQMFGASQTASEIDRLWPQAKIIMVGGHVAALPEQTLWEEQVTYTCNGEGPVTLVGLLHGDALEKIPGLVWRKGETAINNKPAPLCQADELHGDAWDLLDMTTYRSHNWQRFGSLELRQPYASIYTSFGCPFRCSFCCIQAPFSPDLYGNRYRMRTPELVVAEIVDLYRTYGVKTFKIADEMLIMNKKFVFALCDGLIASGIADDIAIWGYSRIDTIKPGMLEKLRAAGFTWLALGIEAAEEYVRDGAEKHFTNADIVKTVRDIEAAGIHVISNWIFGLRHDTMASMNATLAMALELNTAFANFYVCQAYPGSALYDQALAEGWTLPETWAGYSQHNEFCRPLDTEHLTAKQVLAFRDAAFTRYFTNPAYLDMVQQKFGSETVAHVKDMTKYTLKRKLLTGEIA